MKRISQFLLGISLLASHSYVFAQSRNPIVGQYEGQMRQGIQTPNDVSITQDAGNSKKIWIAGIVREEKMYALQTLKNEEQVHYSIPAQQVGKRAIRKGWILLEINQDEEGNDRIMISNDPKSNPNQVSVSKEGVSVKDENGEEVVNVGAKGGVAVDGGDGNVVKISKKGVDAKAGDPAQTAYFTYMGHKPTSASKETDQD